MRNPIRALGGGNRLGAPLTAILLTLLAASPGASGADAALAADGDDEASVDATRAHTRAHVDLGDDATLGASPRIRRPVAADAPAPLDAELRTRGVRADLGPARLALADAGRISTRDGAWASAELAVKTPPACVKPLAACAPSLSATLRADNANVLAADDPEAAAATAKNAAAAPARPAPAAPPSPRAPPPDDAPRGLDPAAPQEARRDDDAAPRHASEGATVTYVGTSAPTPLPPAPLLLLVAATFAIGLAALLAAPVALYHRIRGRDLLASGTRGRVHAHVRDHPGASASDVARALALDPTTARYHLRRLEKAGLASPEGNARRERWFAAGTLDAPARKALLVPDGARRVLDALATRPHATKSELARALALGRATIAWHVERLADAGLVECARVGREVRVRARTTGAAGER